MWLSGELGGHIPFDIEGTSGRLIFPLLWQVWSHVLTFGSPIGRKALPKIRAGKEPLIRVKPKQLAAAGVEFVPRTAGVRDGLPVLDDQRVLDVASVVWCTGYRPQHDWIDLPVLDDNSDLETDHTALSPPSQASTESGASSCTRSTRTPSAEWDATQSASPSESPKGASSH